MVNKNNNMKRIQILIFLGLLILCACSKPSAPIPIPDPIQPDPIPNMPLQGVFFLGFQAKASGLDFDNALFRDGALIKNIISYPVDHFYVEGIHHLTEERDGFGFKYYGRAYLASQRTRIAYIDKNDKFLLASKAGWQVADDFDESIEAKTIYQGSLYLSVKATNVDNTITRNYCYKVLPDGSVSVIPTTNEEFYGLEFMQVLPSGLHVATVGSPYADGRFRIYNPTNVIAAIDISIPGFKHSYVQGFHMINENLAELLIQAYGERDQLAETYYARYNLNTKVLQKYRIDASYDHFANSFTDWTYDAGCFYVSGYQSGIGRAYYAKIKFDEQKSTAVVEINDLQVLGAATRAYTSKIFVKNGNVFITGHQGGKYSYWENKVWKGTQFQGDKNFFITDIIFKP
ncbi:MAG: hypothetical protein EOO01_17145 [Chitinophagaceae bacterium]|nr:MAG: hypothetical protein EOO01_17145 [Chitinophagaceae bacterium]